MANHKSALKKIRVIARRHKRNRIYISRTRTEIKQAISAIAGGSVEDARAATIQAISVLDKAVSKGILHKNNAARRKSRLVKRLNALEASKK